MTVARHSLTVVLLASLGAGALAGLWNGILVAVLKIQPFVATLILMVAGRGVAQLITSGQIVTFDSPHLAWLGSGSLLLFPTPVVIAIGSLMGGRFNLLLSVVGALIIQGMNTGILLSGFPPELNQVVKAVVVLCVLIVQSPRFISILKGMRGHDKT